MTICRNLITCLEKNNITRNQIKLKMMPSLLWFPFGVTDFFMSSLDRKDDGEDHIYSSVSILMRLVVPGMLMGTPAMMMIFSPLEAIPNS